MDAIDYISVAITGSQIRLHTAAGDAGVDRIAFDFAVMSGLMRDDVPDEWLERGKFIIRLFTDFYEVTLSLECLENIPVYLRRFPYRGLGISRAAHLRYHQENWLNEVYLLEERLKTFMKRAKRAYSGSAMAADVTAACDAGITSLTRSLQAIREVRSTHVHEMRYVDRDILLLDSSESSAAHNPTAPFDPEAEFRRVRKLKASETQQLNQMVRAAVASAAQPLADCLVVVEGRDVWLRVPFPV